MRARMTTRDGVSPRWDKPGLPRKGWECFDVEDRKDRYFTCEMCGFTKVRYVHLMFHHDCSEIIRVGCVCAGHMEENYSAPKERERELRNRAARLGRLRERHSHARMAWTFDWGWKTSAKGNLWRNAEGLRIVVFPSHHSDDAWDTLIGEEFGKHPHPTQEEAMLATFDRLFPLDRFIGDFNDHEGRSTLKFPNESGYVNIRFSPGRG